MTKIFKLKWPWALGIAAFIAWLINSVLIPEFFAVDDLQFDDQTVRWPFGNGADATPVSRAYCEFEQSGSYSTHGGTDFHESPGVEVRAMESGEVVFVYGSPANPLNYELVVRSDADPTRALHYVHFQPLGGAHVVGDAISKDVHLGDSVAWGTNDDYDHIHVSRVTLKPGYENLPASTRPFDHSGNVLAEIPNLPPAADLSVDDFKFFEDEIPSELDKDELVGMVDVVVRVGNKFPSANDPITLPYGYALKITKQSTSKLVYSRQVTFDGAVGNLADLANQIYKTDGGADLKATKTDRQFYVVATHDLTNDGAWNTEHSDSGAGDYDVVVTVTDVSGATVTASVTVTVK